MPSRRCLKAAEAIRQVVSTAILMELRDPRIEHVTVTRVEVAPDMRTAKIHVSVMGDEAKQKLCLHGLRSSTGFLQQRVAKRIDTRYTPHLSFELDSGVKRSLEVSRLLDEVLPKRPEDDVSGSDELAASDDDKLNANARNGDRTPQNSEPRSDDEQLSSL